jgi:hypothetical protein
MSKKHISGHSPQADVPYDTRDETAVKSFWDEATVHRGLTEFRASVVAPRKRSTSARSKLHYV